MGAADILYAKVLDDGTMICPECSVPSHKWIKSKYGSQCDCGFGWETEEARYKNRITNDPLPFCLVIPGEAHGS